MTDLSDEDLDALEKLIQAVPDGIWTPEVEGSNRGRQVVVRHRMGRRICHLSMNGNPTRFDMCMAEAALIARARNALPALIAEVRRRRQGDA